jgi:hypothetical protein
MDYAHLAHHYLIDRGISPEGITALKIRWVTYEDAVTLYGYGRLATSPDGVILFPMNPNGSVTSARNFYSTDLARVEHLATINRYQQSKGLAPTDRVPKYLLPKGDLAKGFLYDPYTLLHPASDTPDNSLIYVNP